VGGQEAMWKWAANWGACVVKEAICLSFTNGTKLLIHKGISYAVSHRQ
jgi:hypothetical protein